MLLRWYYVGLVGRVGMVASVGYRLLKVKLWLGVFIVSPKDSVGVTHLCSLLKRDKLGTVEISSCNCCFCFFLLPNRYLLILRRGRGIRPIP